MSADIDESVDESEKFLQAAYALTDKSGTEEFYRQWARRYDRQMQEGLGYVSPVGIVDKLALHLATRGSVVDIGCGTGLVGRELQQRGFLQVDGIDFSREMLDVAGERGIYSELIHADLTETLDIEDNKYTAAVCAGTFTHGHVGPEAFDEISRIVAPGGLLAFTVHIELWDTAGFSEKLLSMVKQNHLHQIERTMGPYFQGGEDEGWFCVFEKK